MNSTSCCGVDAVHCAVLCRELAEESGIENWKRAPALNTNARWV